MKSRYLLAIVAAIVLIAAAGAQDGSSAPQAGQNAGPGQGGRYGQRGGRGAFGGGMMGTVTEAAADHYTIKTEAGEVYTVHLSSNTRILKQVAGMRGPGGGGGMGEGADQGAGGGNGGGAGQGGGRASGGGQGMGRGGNPPQEIKATDIKVGDVVTVMGETDATAKSVAATAVALMDPQRVQQMREREANFGKTWLMGKVTAIDGAKITLTGVMDNTPHTVVADENTTFRKRRDPVTLADIQVGDTVRADGALKDGVFTATAVNVGGMMGGDTPSVPRSAPPQ